MQIIFLKVVHKEHAVYQYISPNVFLHLSLLQPPLPSLHSLPNRIGEVTQSNFLRSEECLRVYLCICCVCDLKGLLWPVWYAFKTPSKIPDYSLGRPDLSAFGEEKAKSGMKKENSKMTRPQTFS